MEYGASTATLSKKLSNGCGFSGKSAYDGVFAGPPKFRATSFSSRVEDYSEIFGVSEASGGSSIPILEVPELNERRVSDNIRPSKLDYSKVFGEFENLDTAVSYEELFAEPKRGDGSPKEERSPAKRGSPTSGENPSCVAANLVISHEASYQSFDGEKKFSVSYHKMSQGCKNGSNGMTHIAQIHTVPGYTCLIDDSTPLKNEADKTLHSVAANTYPNGNIYEKLNESRFCSTAVTSPPPDDASKQSSGCGVDVQNRSNRHSSDTVHLSDASDITHGSCYINMFPSDTPACNSDNHKDDSERSVATHSKASNSDASEVAGGDYSPPSFDDLVDSNSEAAVSVAALRKAIEEAQERLKVAKELMKRKKGGLRDHVKLKEGKMACKENRKKETKTEDIFEEIDASLQVPIGIGKKMMRPDQVTSDLGVKGVHFAAKEAIVETQKENEAEEMEEEVEWEEANEYFELVDTNKYKATRLEFEQADNIKRISHNVDNYECNEKNLVSKAYEKLDECGETFTVEPWGQENKIRVCAGNGACEDEEILDETKLAQEEILCERKEERLTVPTKHQETEKKVKASCKLEDCERKPTEFHEQTENEKEIAHDRGKIEKNSEESIELEECEKYLTVHQESVEDEKKVAPELNENEEKVEVSCGLEVCGLRKDQELIENERTFEPQDLDLKNIGSQTENQEWIEHGNIGKETCYFERNEKELDHVCGEGVLEMRFNNLYEQEIIDKMVDSFHGKEELEKRLTEDHESYGNKKLQEAEENEKALDGASYRMEDIEKREEETCEWVEVDSTPNSIDETVEVTQEASKCEKENNNEAVNIYEQDEIEILSENQEADLCMENKGKLEVCSQVPVHEEQDNLVGVAKPSFQLWKNEKEPKAVDDMSNFEVKDTLETVGLTQGSPRLDVPMDHREDTIETIEFDTTEIKSGEAGMTVGQNQDQCDGEVEIVCKLGMHLEEPTPGYAEMNKDAKEAEFSMNEDISQNYNEFSCEEICVSDRDNIEAATQLPSMSEGESKSIKDQEAETRQATEKVKENHQATLPMEEKKVCTASHKVELEKEHIRKIDEEKEREKEREKEKLAVERAIREARERAFAEARERAAVDRATSEARRRMMSDARDRLGKTSSQTGDKVPAEKSAAEARLKAERAAVERATTEARLRALEKAMSEKAAFEARSKVDKFTADKSSGAFRDNGTRQNFSHDKQDNGSFPYSFSRYKKSSNNGVPHSTEIFDGANVESAQRCKARSERHQRIVERAEKALAEKNMRDLLAQKEQEERNRLAEALDADVRRWSSGKEGKLRALLSTLHYVLGPDSGWQPIPLTDIVATAAVKKAYRRATLFVHPDKLQQRGATIQQKYTCEKVFDLLKDAWNKFNMEER
ncbi:Auxilin-like protein 1 [Quillaja saponaria]|uniref:Auxilin-like protein 1 n=1 Tax=Quillaja saponaria TaxID=32244 RepID=A0AAD7LLR5_QUISA|nr:Auxilin-like protein 1 [Quillaja saponaria]